MKDGSMEKEKVKVCNACLSTLESRKAYKCSACKSVNYCSKSCQRRDWKQHKSFCKRKQQALRSEDPQQQQVLWASSELNKLVLNTSLDEALEKYHRAQDDIENLHSNLKKRGGASSTIEAIPPPQPSHKGQGKKNGDVLYPCDEPLTKKISEHEKITDESNEWNYTVEKLIYVASFNVILARSLDGNVVVSSFPKKEDVDISISDIGCRKRRLLRVIVKSAHNGSGHERLVASIVFPESIESTKVEILATLCIQENIITIRLKYQQDGALLHAENEVSMLSLKSVAPTNVEALNNVKCRFCKQLLLHSTMPKRDNEETWNKKILKKSLPLPVGFWDDIVDYITCYEGVCYYFASCLIFMKPTLKSLNFPI